MFTRAIFDEDKENCNLQLEHVEMEIEEENIDPELKEIDELYGYADALSKDYAKKHFKSIRHISILGPAIVVSFLLYDELEAHFLILPCLILVGLLLYIYFDSQKKRYHEKYIEYRVFAETLRLQYFVSIAGLEKNVSEFLPWFIKIGNAWIKESLEKFGAPQIKPAKTIIDRLIRPQLNYHENAKIDSKQEHEKNNYYQNIVIILTGLAYLVVFVFEFGIIYFIPFDMFTLYWIRAGFKIFVGFMSAFALFLANYYGKKSLSSKSEEHRRMELLYRDIDGEIIDNKDKGIGNEGETKEIIEELAREFLIENATWYAHQKKNSPEIAIG